MTNWTVKKTPTLSKRDLLVANLHLVAIFAALSWLVWHWCSPTNYLSSKSLFLLSLGYIAYSSVLYYLRYFIIYRAARPTPIEAADGLRVGVVTTYVAGEAPLGVVEKTLRAMVAMDYQHDTFLLDESNDQTIKDLCSKIGVKHFSRAGIERYNQKQGTFATKTRHGNYNAWLDAVGYSHYDFVAVFDLDHIPHKNYLERTLGYFKDDNIGYVQPPQVYYNKKDSWVARGAAEKTYRYYSLGQMARFGSDMTILDGCHNVNRTAALKDIGGFQPHKADDLLTTLSYVAKGWKGVYVPEILAEGQAPMDLRSYFVQQFQWAYTTLDIKLRHLIRIFPTLSRKQKVTALMHGTSYLSGIRWLITHSILFYIVASNNNLPLINWQLFLFLAPLFVLRVSLFYWQQKFYVDPATERGFHWRNFLVSYAVLPYYCAAALLVPFRLISSFRVIPKFKRAKLPIGFVTPHAITLAIAVSLAFRSIMLGHSNMTVLYVLIAIVACMNFVPIFLSLKSTFASKGAAYR